MSSRGKGKRFNDFQRVEIVRKLQKPNPPSKRALAREYEVSESVIRKIWNSRDDIQQRTAFVSESDMKNIFRTSRALFPELEDTLYQWIDTMRRAKVQIPPSLVMHKARQIADSLNISENNFKASWCWFKNFKKRKGIGSMYLHGEGAEVDRNDPELLRALDSLYESISQYDPENVYNMDETGLFFRVLPRYTLLMPNEDVSTTRGKKKSKERISLVVCCNAIGSHKIPCTIIGKAKTPACIRGRNWPTPYYSQKNAWMDVDVCWKWFNEVFFPLVRRRTSRPVLLLLDNAPGHFDAFERDGVKVLLFPPNCTSWKQPCDMGIITALKKTYKYLYLKDVLLYYDLDEETKARKNEEGARLLRGAAGVEYGRPAHILDAANYVKESWEAVQPQSILNCFRKAEIMRFNNAMSHNIGEEKDQDDMLELVQNHVLRDEFSEEVLKEYVSIDNEDSEVYNTEVMKDVDELVRAFNENSVLFSDDEDAENENENENENDDINSQMCDDGFDGFSCLYSKILDLKEQIVLGRLEQIGAAHEYDSLLKEFETLEFTMRRIVRLEDQSKLAKSRQLTPHDCFKK